LANEGLSPNVHTTALLLEYCASDIDGLYTTKTQWTANKKRVNAITQIRVTHACVIALDYLSLKIKINPFRFGVVVEGDQFFNREKEVAEPLFFSLFPE